MSTTKTYSIDTTYCIDYLSNDARKIYKYNNRRTRGFTNQSLFVERVKKLNDRVFLAVSPIPVDWDE
jgi:hypothetical protein